MSKVYNAGHYQFDEREYLQWLKNQVCRGAPRLQNYSLLLGSMYKTPFQWANPLDANRAADGLSLRTRFALENGYYISDDPVKECSVLEMLIALCIRVEREIMGSPGDDHPERWFWQIIDNMGLAVCSDDMFEYTYYNQKITDFLFRRYKPNGIGGPFPIRNSRRDLRLLDIWAQMNAWLVYNYPSEIG